MKLAVIANDLLQEEFRLKETRRTANICFVATPQQVPSDAAVVADLLFEHTSERVSLLRQFLPRPVFVNAVTDTLASIGEPFIRINAWPTFLKRTITEVVVLPEQLQVMQDLFQQLGWQFQVVPDITGMISPRIVCTIINEAYFTAGEEVATRDAIDTAMKLGTNYPYGPFEWGKKIGLETVHDLLSQLCKENNLYEVSTLLKNELKN